MSFLRRIYNASANIATTVTNTITNALYNAAVNVYQNIVGQPAPVVEQVIQQTENIQQAEEFIETTPDEVLEEEPIDIQEHNRQKFKEIQKAIDKLKINEKKVFKLTYIDKNGNEKEAFYILNSKTRNNIKRAINNFLAISDTDDIQLADIYDPVVEYAQFLITGFEILDVNKPENAKPGKQGGLFKYKHLINNEEVIETLEKLQIFYKDSPINLNENCFINAVKDHLSEEELIYFKTTLMGDFVKLRKLKGILTKFDIAIECRELTNRGDVRYVRLNNGASRKIQIGLVDEHYFPYIEKTNITKFYLENWENINCPNATLTVKEKNNKYYQITKTTEYQNLDSYQLVKFLFKNRDKFLSEICSEEKVEWVDEDFKGEFRPYLDIDKYTRELPTKEPKINFDHWMTFDTETYNKEDGRTIVYLACCSDTDRTFYSMNAFIDYLLLKYGVEKEDKDKTKTILIYAHNSTFDAVHLIRYLFAPEICMKNGKYVFLKGWIFGKTKRLKIIVKDSYRLIEQSLANIPKTFNLEQKKEVMYYDMYNLKTVSRQYGKNGKLTREKIQEYINQFNKTDIKKSEEQKKEDEETFWLNVKDWNCEEDGKINILKYSAEYCHLDCKVLKLGIEKFRDLMFKINPKIDIHNYYSISSIADWNLRIEGCYEGVLEFNGVLGDYFQEAIVGGRCMLKQNKPQNVEKEIDDFDAVSLYPSAMIMGDGMPKGKPKLIEELEYYKIKKYDYYVVTIKLNKVNIKRNFPLIPFKTKNGNLWTNDISKYNQIRVDKYALEDLIKFQKVEFEIIDGYYFDESFNTKIKEVILKLFNWRQEIKKDNPPLGNTIKLMMNSPYGKTIQKSIKTQHQIVPSKKKDNFIDTNYNFISQPYTELYDSDNYLFETRKSIVESWSRPQCGGAILSRSKRIMNEVICTGEDMDCDILYQDTDSIHIVHQDLDKLCNEYKKRYGRDLIGKKPNNFHCDFSLEGSDESKLRSTHFIGVAKKVYYDALTDGKITGDHFRMKGISPHIVKHQSKKEEKTIKGLYLEHLKGKEIAYDINAGGRIRFDKNKDQSYTAFTGEFTRKIQFKNGVEVIQSDEEDED